MKSSFTYRQGRIEDVNQLRGLGIVSYTEFGNVLTDENGEKAALKPGAKVDVVLEADATDTVKKPDS